MKKIGALVMALALAACAIPPSESEMSSADFGPYPTSWEEIIKGYLEARLKDPYSAQYQFENSPQRGFQGLGGAKYGWVVCARVNAKNSFGGYTGYRPAYFMIRDDRVIDASIGDGSYGDALAIGKCKKFVGKFDAPSRASVGNGVFLQHAR